MIPNVQLELDNASTPEEIEQRSFAIIDAEVGEPRAYSGRLWAVTRRCIHAMGDPDITNQLFLSDSALDSALAAMRRGCVIYTDTRMLAAGLVARRMNPLGIKVVPVLELPGVQALARRENCTRTRAGMKLVARQMAGNIVAIGNAPTALLAVLEELEKKECAAPALIVGMPVGFVNAAQSKEMLIASGWPAFVLRGRKGGSAVAAACLNAVANLALELL